MIHDNASTGDVLSTRVAPEWRQTADRAEVHSILSNCGLQVWSDCQHVAEQLQRMLTVWTSNIPENNEDLSTRISCLLDDRCHLITEARWIPSHLSASHMEDPIGPLGMSLECSS